MFLKLQTFIFLYFVTNVSALRKYYSENPIPPLSKTEALFDAASKGNSTAVLALINAGVDVNAVDGKQFFYHTALTYAAENGQVTTMRVLLDHGANIGSPRNIGYTVLMRAAEFGQLGSVKLLLDRGADVNATETFLNMTALMYSIKGQRGGLFGVDSSKTNLIIQMLLDHDANVNAGDLFEQTALMKAAIQGKLEIVNLLLDYGADIDATDASDSSAIMYAADNDNDDIVKLLMKRGANTAGCMSQRCNPRF